MSSNRLPRRRQEGHLVWVDRPTVHNAHIQVVKRCCKCKVHILLPWIKDLQQTDEVCCTKCHSEI